MLLGMVFSTFGAGSLPAAGATDAARSQLLNLPLSFVA